MADMEDLDLTKPGKIWAEPEWETTTVFHMVVPNDNYTKDKLIKNQTIAPADKLMDEVKIPHNQLKDGKAVLDLVATGRGKAIMAKLEERIHKNQAVGIIRAVILADAADGNRIPEKFDAETIDFRVATIPTITLLGKQIYVTAQNFKAGIKNFTAELKITNPLKEVKITVEPGLEISVSTGQKGNGSLTLPVKEGQTYTISVPVAFRSRSEERTVVRVPEPSHYHRWVAGGWRTQTGYDNYQDTQRQEVWDGGTWALKVAGTGPFDSLQKAVQLRAEGWASGWLWKNPPRTFGHNIC